MLKFTPEVITSYQGQYCFLNSGLKTSQGISRLPISKISLLAFFVFIHSLKIINVFEDFLRNSKAILHIQNNSKN